MSLKCSTVKSRKLKTLLALKPVELRTAFAIVSPGRVYLGLKSTIARGTMVDKFHWANQPVNANAIVSSDREIITD